MKKLGDSGTGWKDWLDGPKPPRQHNGGGEDTIFSILCESKAQRRDLDRREKGAQLGEAAEELDGAVMGKG